MTIQVKLSEAREKAEEARKQIEAAQETMAEAIKETIINGLNPIFEKYPFLGSVTWTQYTPYFNDGEPCVFSSQIDYPSCNTKEDEEEGTIGYCEEPGECFGKRSTKEHYGAYDSATRTYEKHPNSDYDPQYEECQKAVCDFTGSLRGSESRRPYGDHSPTTFDSAMLQAFGDHCQVSVTRDGIEVDSYEHE